MHELGRTRLFRQKRFELVWFEQVVSAIDGFVADADLRNAAQRLAEILHERIGGIG